MTGRPVPGCGATLRPSKPWCGVPVYEYFAAGGGQRSACSRRLGGRKRVRIVRARGHSYPWLVSMTCPRPSGRCRPLPLSSSRTWRGTCWPIESLSRGSAMKSRHRTRSFFLCGSWYAARPCGRRRKDSRRARITVPMKVLSRPSSPSDRTEAQNPISRPRRTCRSPLDARVREGRGCEAASACPCFRASPARRSA